ncbi:hypothetical protein [Nonomuraea sp. NPDC049400]|uniref:hypothetical protein n=1 Tax=Nonomuraea sp. NPDC049400 TaxID=3364352 RepID=UPI0037B45DC8
MADREDGLTYSASGLLDGMKGYLDEGEAMRIIAERFKQDAHLSTWNFAMVSGTIDLADAYHERHADVCAYLDDLQRAMKEAAEGIAASKRNYDKVK